MKTSQRDLIHKLLVARGNVGVSAHELTYQHGITRSAARVHELRQQGMNIITVEAKHRQAVYVLMPA